MSGKFRAVLQLAHKTFDRSNETLFVHNFNRLQELVNDISCKDLGISDPDDIFNSMALSNDKKAPCSYMHIYENDSISMSIFIMRGDFKMPLHDHPCMYGLVKVLYGKLRVQSYTIEGIDSDLMEPSGLYPLLKTQPYRVKRELPVIRSPSSSCSILTPTRNNFHELTAIDSVAAFFDILAPPYGTVMPNLGRRFCTFYRARHIDDDTKQSSSNDDDNSHKTVLLEKITSPKHYYCDTLPTPKGVEEMALSCSGELTINKI